MYDLAASKSAFAIWKQITKNFSFVTSKPHVLYRGLIFSPKTKGQFKKELSNWFKASNQYLTYCSTNRDVAFRYAAQADQDETSIGILLKITVNPGTRICPLLTCSKMAHQDEFVITGGGNFYKIDETTDFNLVGEMGKMQTAIYETEVIFEPSSPSENKIFLKSIEHKFKERFDRILDELAKIDDYK
jgi:hypothetical protein